jgi:hypothetical protein
MTLRKLPLLAEIVLLFGMANVLPASCFARPADAGDSAVSTVGLYDAIQPSAPAVPRALDLAEPQPADPPASTPATPLPPAGSSESPRIGIGVTAGLLGFGGQVAVRVANKINVRGGFNFAKVSDSLTDSGIHYGAALNLKSVDALVDFFLFRGFHVSPGVLIYDGNGITANVSVPGGQTFTLGGTQYESSTANPLLGTGNLTFNKVAPEFLFGPGNLVPRGHRHWSVTFEAGIAYQGAPKTVLSLTGSACTPPNSSGPTCQNAATNSSIQANVQSQQASINHDTSFFRIWPVLTVGFGYSF